MTLNQALAEARFRNLNEKRTIYVFKVPDKSHKYRVNYEVTAEDKTNLKDHELLSTIKYVDRLKETINSFEDRLLLVLAGNPNLFQGSDVAGNKYRFNEYYNNIMNIHNRDKTN